MACQYWIHKWRAYVMKNFGVAFFVLGIMSICIFAAYTIGYSDAIKDAELVSVSESGYEICFGNQIHYYE